MTTENSYISLCKKRIEKELNLQNDSLMQRDFEYLSKVIFERSGIDLSTATLRRIWSEDREGVPQAKTLDAMAKVLGFNGWHEFKKANAPVQSKIPSSFNRVKWWQVMLVTVAAGSWIWLSWDRSRNFEVLLSPEKSSHEGVPATIGFNYDISEAGESEVKIQLSWNPYEQTVLDPDKNFYTGTYFYPDYHEAKLIAGEKVLASCYIHITTPGWHGLIMKSGFDSNPIYVDSEDFILENRLTMTQNLKEKYGLSQLERMYSVFTFSNEVLEKVDGDSFELSTSFQDLGYLSNPTCSQIDILVKGASGSIRVPISSEGCYGITEVRCSDVSLPGKTNNLSSLSTDLLQAATVNLKVRNSKLLARVGENEPLEITYSQAIGPLKIIKFIFMGYGEVTQFELEGLEDDRLEPF